MRETMKKVLIAKPLYELIGKEKSFLRRADIRVTAVPTNDDLLASCRAEPPDLIISQLDLSGRDSAEVFEALRNGGML
jgi:DNA-binding response OmpR family regulator